MKVALFIFSGFFVVNIYIYIYIYIYIFMCSARTFGEVEAFFDDYSKVEAFSKGNPSGPDLNSEIWRLVTYISNQQKFNLTRIFRN